MFYLTAYTRMPEEKTYSRSLAGSIHFKYSTDGTFYRPLNQNYGMLFPLAKLTKDNTIDPRCIQTPALYQKDSTYGIAAEYTDLHGTKQDDGCVYFWTTKDFLSFCEIGLLSTEELSHWECAKDNVLLLSDAMGKEIVDAWTPLSASAVFLPRNPAIHSVDDLNNVKAIMEYSDGSRDEKIVDWDIPEDALLPDGTFKTGAYQLNGRLHKDNLSYPLAIGYADPVFFLWEGFWYFLSTNDNLGDIGMYLRRAKTVEGLFDGSATERCILPYNPDKGFVQTFWAPEFHLIGEELYILFAVGGKQWAPQCHMMKLKRNGDLLNPEDWDEPIRVQKKDGTPLTTDGITLDMTYFKAGGKHYVAWSYRYGIGTPMDTGSMIYIATTDEKRPWLLTSEPVLLSRPLYGWEHTDGTINNEGPYPLVTDTNIYLAFSGGSANAYSYAVGYMIADVNADLLDIKNWVKTPCPVLSSYSVGIDGPGHNSFYRSEDGKTMVAYHGQLHTRCSAVHRVHFNKHGFPLLNMAPERDIPESMRNVQLNFEVK